MEIGKTLRVTNRRAWRSWLAKHHATEPEIWLERRRDAAATTGETPALRPYREMFTRYRRVTITASLLAASVLVAYWGLFSWLPGFLATPVAEGGAGLTLTACGSDSTNTSTTSKGAEGKPQRGGSITVLEETAFAGEHGIHLTALAIRCRHGVGA